VFVQHHAATFLLPNKVMDKIFLRPTIYQFVVCPVLPGPEEASPLFEPKFTAIWRKYTASSNFVNIPHLSRYFWAFNIF
jgi:hypothetical protein